MDSMENDKVRILIVDDEPDIREFVSYNLMKEGYKVLEAKNGREAVQISLKYKPELILLDIMMPEMDGIEVCSEIRENPEMESTLIVFLSARGEDYSQIAGFQAGGDDYITKPIRPKVLISRIQSLLKRRLAPESSSNIPSKVSPDDLVIDTEGYTVLKNGEAISLTRKEFELLALLSDNPNKVIRREQIFSKVWGTDSFVGERTIDVHIRKIREKTGTNRIKTIKGIGYKFEK